MLGVRRVAQQGAAYYLSDLARELPVAEPGRWVGSAGAALGLEGAVDPAGLHRLLSGRHPVSGHAMPAAGGRTSVAAYDLTFSAPKSVSVTFGLGGREVAALVEAAHLDAVEGAMRYLEQHAVTAVRRSGPARVVVPTTGMVAARFTHGLSRNGDPHLHSHVVMANLVHGEDGRWSACDRRGLDAHRRAAGAVYEAGLRDGLTRALGVQWTRPLGRSAEVAGVSEALLGEFSSRGADIRLRVHETGGRSHRGRFVAWASTRGDKDLSVLGYDEVARDWGRRADALGSGGLPPFRTTDRADRVDRADRARRAQPPEPRVLDEHAFAAAVSLTPHGGVHRRDVVAAFAGAARDGMAAGAVEHLTERWAPATDAPPGVAEPLRPRSSVVPGNHLVRALGPRPLDPAEHDVWVGAARALDEYRARWGLERSSDPLGLDESAGGRHGAVAVLPAARLAEHVRASRRLDEARARLGHRRPAEIELGLGLGR